MPQKLSERPEELVRQYLADNIRPSEIENYNPQQTDETASDFLPITNNWNKWGDTYPIIYVSEDESPTVPNSGNTGFNGMQGDGSGVNAYSIKNVSVSCQAVELENSSGYRNGVAADDLAYTLYQECYHQFQNNVTTAISEALHNGLTPPDGIQTRNSEETDSGSTLSWIQRTGTCQVGVINTP